MRHDLRTIAICVATAVGPVAPRPSAAADIDCGPQPTLACLAPHIFALAWALPASDMPREYQSAPALSRRRKAMLRVAEEELAPVNLDLALRVFLDENPDPLPWEDIRWIAETVGLDRAIAVAEAADNQLRRLGGLTMIAQRLARAGQPQRAAAIVNRIEPDLTTYLSDSEWEQVLRDDAAEIWFQLGDVDRALSRLSTWACLKLAKTYPGVAERLRRQAWQQAERDDQYYTWDAVAQDGRERGDDGVAAEAERRAAAARARAGYRPLAQRDPVQDATGLATCLFDAGQTEKANRAIDPWRTWVAGKYAVYLAEVVRDVAPLLARLERDAEFEEAARMVADSLTRSVLFGEAAADAYQKGRPEVAARWEATAITTAQSMANEWLPNPEQRGEAFARLAALRNQRGDVAGALSLLAQIPNEAAELTVSIIATAIDRGSGPSAVPFIQRLEASARRWAEADLLLSAAALWQRAGHDETARTTFADALSLRRSSPQNLDLQKAVELIWRLDRDFDAVEARLDAVVTTEKERRLVREARLNIALANAPGEAVRIAGKLANPLERLEALERVARKVIDSQVPDDAR